MMTSLGLPLMNYCDIPHVHTHGIHTVLSSATFHSAAEREHQEKRKCYHGNHMKGYCHEQTLTCTISTALTIA